jgi:hypothetical protein
VIRRSVKAFRVEPLIQPISGEISFPALRQWLLVALVADIGPLLREHICSLSRKCNRTLSCFMVFEINRKKNFNLLLNFVSLSKFDAQNFSSINGL